MWEDAPGGGPPPPAAATRSSTKWMSGKFDVTATSVQTKKNVDILAPIYKEYLSGLYSIADLISSDDFTPDIPDIMTNTIIYDTKKSPRIGKEKEISRKCTSRFYTNSNGSRKNHWKSSSKRWFAKMRNQHNNTTIPKITLGSNKIFFV